MAELRSRLLVKYDFQTGKNRVEVKVYISYMIELRTKHQTRAKMLLLFLRNIAESGE